MWIIVICFACIIIAGYLYWVNGRSIFEDRAAPTEAEMETIQKIIAFEQQKLAECKELLAPYHNRAKELGVEIRPVLEQFRAVNRHGLVEKHDLNRELWLPKFYGSEITVSIYKDGKLLEKRESHDTISYFVSIFWLVKANKSEEPIEFNQNPFNNSYKDFEAAITDLLQRVSEKQD